MKKKTTLSNVFYEMKKESVRLLETGHHPASEITLELGIRRNQLYN